MTSALEKVHCGAIFFDLQRTLISVQLTTLDFRLVQRTFKLHDSEYTRTTYNTTGSVLSIWLLFQVFIKQTSKNNQTGLHVDRPVIPYSLFYSSSFSYRLPLFCPPYTTVYHPQHTNCSRLNYTSNIIQKIKT